jgi:hypothetical protein
LARATWILPSATTVVAKSISMSDSWPPGMPIEIGLVEKAGSAPPNGAAAPRPMRPGEPPPPPVTTSAITSSAAAWLAHWPSRPMWLQRTIDTTAVFDSLAFLIATSVPKRAATWPKVQLPSTSAVVGVSSMIVGRASGLSPPDLIWLT